MAPREFSDAEVFGSLHELSDEDVFGSGKVTAQPASARKNGFEALVAGVPQQRSPVQRLVDNVVDSVARSGLGQLDRDIRRGGGGLGYINVQDGGLADRALDAMFGNDRAIARGVAPHVDPVDAAERARRAAFAERGEADPYYRAGDGGLGDKLVAGAATLGGQVVGGALSPENWIAPGKTVAQRILRNAATAGGADVLLQGGDVGSGVQEKYNPAQTGGAVVVGGALAAGAEGTARLAARFFRIGPVSKPGSPEAKAEAQAALEAVSDPIIRAQLEASGITPESNPNYAAFVQRAEQIKATRAAAAADPYRNAEPQSFAHAARPEGAPPPSSTAIAASRLEQTLDHREDLRAAQQDLEARTQLPPDDPDYIHPAALPSAGTEHAVPGAPMRVTPEGQAFTPSEGALVGQDLRKPSNLPVVTERQVQPMSDAEIAAARAEPRANPIRERDTMVAPEGRAPQMRDDVQAQREAGGAFALADRQRARIAEDVRDTQPAGLPKGPEPQRVMLDEGFPIRIVEEGKGGAVRVERYDPRTGLREDGAEPYWTTKGSLHQTDYTPEPRRAQDFGARDNPARMSPEEPRMASAPVTREPTQTFRATDERPGADGGPPLPEQLEGPAPWPSQPRGERAERARTEDELHARYTNARSDEGEQAFADRARAAYRDREFKTSPSVAEPGADGRFDVDEFGFVRSAAGGPVTYGTQKQAANWILNVGHRRSPDQIFEIANGPKRGFTVREAGRARPEPEGAPKAEVGATAQPRRPDAVTPLLETRAADAAAPLSDVGTRRHTASAGRAAPEGRSAYERYQAGEAKYADLSPDEQARVQRDQDDANFQVTQADEPGVTREAYDARRDEGMRRFREFLGERPEPDKAQANGDAQEPAARPAEPAKSEPGDGAGSEGSKGTTLYSNPLDPDALNEHLVKPLRKVVDAELAAAKRDKAWLNRVFADIDTRPKAVADQALHLLMRTVREGGMSGAGALRSFAKKYPDVPELKTLADALATDPGSGRAIAEPYEMASLRVGQEYINRAKNIVGALAETPEGGAALRSTLTGGRRSAAVEAPARRVRKLLDEFHAYLKDSGVDVGYVRDYFPRLPDPVRVEAKRAQFIEAATKVYRAEGAADPAAAARVWAEEIISGRELHVSRDPGGALTTRPTRERSFKSRDADRILEPFMSDVPATLANYFASAARQAEFARRFGPRGEKLDEMFQGMASKGVDSRDLTSVRYVADGALGLLPSTAPNAAGVVANWIHTVYTARLLLASASSSVSEPFVLAMRTGDIGVGMRALGDYLTAPFDRSNRREWQERAELLGVIGDISTDALLLRRAGADGVTQSQRIFLSRFFRSVGLTPLTEFQYLTATRLGHITLKRLLDRVDEPNNAPAVRALADLYGLDAAATGRMKTWMAKFGSKPPSVSELMGKTADGQAYAAALNRFAKEGISTANAVDRPALANDPRFRSIFGITSFMMVFTRKVLMKADRDVVHALTAKDYTAAQKVAGVLGPGLAAGIYTALQYGVWSARDHLRNPERADERSDPEKFYTALSQGQVFRNGGPLIDMMLGTMGRYDRDLTSGYAGPQLTTFLGDVAKIIGGLQGGSERTTNSEWQGARAGYNMFLTNAALLGSQFIPTGPLGRIGIFLGLQTVGAPGTSRAFADAVVGERTVKPKARKSEAADDDDFALPDPTAGFDAGEAE